MYDISTEEKREKFAGHEDPGPQGQVRACQQEDSRMGARTPWGSICHSYQSVAGPADALREVVAKRHMIGSGELMGVSLRYERFP